MVSPSHPSLRENRSEPARHARVRSMSPEADRRLLVRGSVELFGGCRVQGATGLFVCLFVFLEMPFFFLAMPAFIGGLWGGSSPFDVELDETKRKPLPGGGE